MRVLSAKFVDSLNAPQTDKVYVALFTIQHPDLQGQVWRVSSDNKDLLDPEEQSRGTRSRGLAYDFVPMEFGLPEQKTDASEVLEVRLSNVTQELMPILLSVRTPASVTLEILLASAPDDVEILFPEMLLKGAQVDAASATLTFVVDDLSRENYPCDQITPAGFPGLWATT